MVDEIAPDRVVAVGLDRHFDLRPHTIGTRHEDRFVETGGHAKHSTESTEAAEHARREGGFDQFFYPSLRRVRGVDVDAGASVSKRIVLHRGSSSSNVTRRRMS